MRRIARLATASWAFSCDPHQGHRAAAGKLSFDGIITHEFPLDAINTALDLVRSGAAGVDQFARARASARVNIPLSRSLSLRKRTSLCSL